MATVSALGARVLRKLGVSLVAQSDRAAPSAPLSSSDVAALVLRDLGIPVAEGDRPAALPPVTPATVAASALRLLGIGQASNEALGSVTQAEIAARALRVVGVNPADLGAVLDGTTYNRADIARRALLKLGVISSEETPATADYADAQNAAAAQHAMLATKDYVTWTVDTVPLQAVEIYVNLTANAIASQYGKPASPQTYEIAEGMLQQVALTGAIAQSRALLKVAAVHAELAADGVISWTLATVPTAAAEHYASMTAQLLAPVHGRQQDMAAYGAAASSVRRIALAGSLGLSVATEKVNRVHEALNAQGLVSWPVASIPQAYAEDYAAMAATLIAAFAGLSRDPATRQVDQAAWDAAMGHVRSGSMIAAQQERALQKVQAVHAEMSTMGLVSWDVDAIPGSMSEAYASAAVALMGAESGKPSDGNAIAGAYQRVRMLAMNGPAGQALAEQKVRAVHYSLEARGRTRWTLANIPSYAEEPYVFMAAFLLGPEMGIKVDPSWGIGPEMNLIRITAMQSTREPVRVDYF